MGTSGLEHKTRNATAIFYKINTLHTKHNQTALYFVLCSMDLEFTLANLPDVRPYNQSFFADSTFKTKVECVRASLFNSKSIVKNFEREGIRANETLFAFSERKHKAATLVAIHKRVLCLLFADMYSDVYDMNGRSYNGDISE